MLDKTLRDLTNELILRDENLRLLAELVDLAPAAISVNDDQGKFLYVNQRTLDLHGYTKEEFLSINLHAHDLPVSEQLINERLEYVKKNGEMTFEVQHYKKDRSIIDLEVYVKSAQWGNRNVFLSSATDISHRKLIEIYKDMKTEILYILNEIGEFDIIIKKVLEILKTKTKFDAVGIRFQDGDDYPYFIQEGFPDDFLSIENSLLPRLQNDEMCLDKNGKPSLECTCGLVISGAIDSNSPHCTDGGSFWTNNSLPFLDLSEEDDPRFKPRNTCIHSGYKSIALIPIKTNNKIVGLIQLNNKKENTFVSDMIEALEDIAQTIGTALLRKKMNKELYRLNSVLTSVLEATTDGILVVGNDQKVVSYSKSFPELWKIPVDIIASKNDEVLLQYVSDQVINPEEFLEKIKFLYSSDEISSDEVNFKDGRVFDRFSQPYKINNVIQGRIWSFRNITKRISAIRERNALTKLLLDSLPCVAILISCDTRLILAMNEKASQVGCEIGKTCFGSWPKLEEPCPYCLAPDACSSCENKHLIINEDDKIWDVYWLPINQKLVVHYALDITDIVRAEEILKQSKNTFKLISHENKQESL